MRGRGFVDLFQQITEPELDRASHAQFSWGLKASLYIETVALSLVTLVKQNVVMECHGLGYRLCCNCRTCDIKVPWPFG